MKIELELELEFKRETGFRPKPQDCLICECGEVLMTGEFYTSNYVEFLIDKIEKHENSKGDSKTD